MNELNPRQAVGMPVVWLFTAYVLQWEALPILISLVFTWALLGSKAGAR